MKQLRSIWTLAVSAALLGPARQGAAGEELFDTKPVADGNSGQTE